MSSLITASLALTTHMPQIGIFDWARDLATEFVVTLLVVGAAAIAVLILVVWLKSGKIGSAIMAGFGGAIVLALIGGGVAYASSLVSAQLQ